MKWLAFLAVFDYALNCMTDRAIDILHAKSVAEQNKARAFLGQSPLTKAEMEDD